ncbi:acyltransferase family protein [Sediminicola luteus]|uniref:acyltransferase family protein n=1 Tax=Sediminicola luteus TaxID=319238 RepID=UPI001556BED0
MKPKKFLWSFHYFRAFAILNIFLVHVWRLPYASIEVSNWFPSIVETIFHGSTIYFIFISGFLTKHLSQTFKIRPYFITKFKKVLFPYVILTCIFFLIFKLFPNPYSYFPNSGLSVLLNYLINGNLFVHFWYIPFVCLIFLITPILLKIPNEFFKKLLPIIILLPLFGTRTGTDISIGQYLYFLPAYLLGMYVSMNKEKTLRLLVKKSALFYISLGFSTITLLLIGLRIIPISNSNIIEGLFYIQKISVIGIILPILEKKQYTKRPFMNLLANTSFAIYFLHYPLARALQIPFFWILTHKIPEFLWIPTSILYCLFVLLICLVVILLTKKIGGKYSKFLIGY